MMPQSKYKMNRPKQPIAPSAITSYNRENRNPLVESDQEKFARKVIESADKQSIPLQEDTTLIKNLLEVDLGDSVPPQLYALIAEVLKLMEEIDD
ncbi:flagellar biosynthesis protein [Cytobacillus eiseniae]|uniref:Flagellar biosynthesis protein n=1 Tax=Cytobacillus eiseniae TaxID=762947 RepID=A0ABS4RGI7_9BACI|nr:EscU/YscU/HrcU family type III secretion system export apparatus switch protein [Cytobacillus eiseniae]MBP2242004.1 flagellar biosynthesis protein [Cytobacillus eiseniae]